MKILKRIFIVIFAAAALLAAVFAAGRYGWRLFGFRACQGAGIEAVEVGQTAVHIRGFYPGSFAQGFCGYYAEQRDGELYVGFRFSGIFGFFETGRFDITVPTDGQIDRVIQKTRTGENVIWDKADSKDDNNGSGVYIKAAADDITEIRVSGADFEAKLKNENGEVLEQGKWLLCEADVAAAAAQNAGGAVPFTVKAERNGEKEPTEATFIYYSARPNMYVTVTELGISCADSDTVGAEGNVPQVVELPVLDRIDKEVEPGAAGASLRAVQAAVRLMEWAENTGLAPDEIQDSAVAWLAQKDEEARTEAIQMLTCVDGACQSLRGEDARELLDSAGCEDTEIFWTSEPLECVEAIMRAAGLRGQVTSRE